MENLIKTYLENMLPNNQFKINLQFKRNINKGTEGAYLLNAFQITTKTPITQKEARELRENLNNIYAGEDNLDQTITIRIREYGEGTEITILNMLQF